MDKELMDILEGKDEKKDEKKSETKDVTQNEEKKEYKEVTLKFGKGCVGDEFQGKDGKSYRQIMIPPNEETKQPWQTFVVRSNQVHENQYGKGMWCKLPAEGSTTVTKSVAKGVDEDGKTIWENEKTKIPNKELKKMVESYKNKEQSQDKADDKTNSLLATIEKKALQANAQHKPSEHSQNKDRNAAL